MGRRMENMGELGLRYIFKVVVFNIKNMKTRRNAILPVSILGLGIKTCPLIEQESTICQLMRRFIEGNPGIVKPIAKPQDLSELVIALENPGRNNRLLYSCISSAMNNLIVEVPDEDYLNTHFVFSINREWNFRILDYAIQPQLSRDFQSNPFIDEMNDSLGNCVKELSGYTWDNEMVDQFYQKFQIEPKFYPVGTDRFDLRNQISPKVEEPMVVEDIDRSSVYRSTMISHTLYGTGKIPGKIDIPDSISIEERSKEKLAVLTKILYPSIDSSSIVLVGSEYTSTLTALKYLKLQYKKCLMTSSEFLKNPSCSLVEIPLFELSQKESIIHTKQLQDVIFKVSSRVIGYRPLLFDRFKKYPKTTEVLNMQILLD